MKKSIILLIILTLLLTGCNEAKTIKRYEKNTGLFNNTRLLLQTGKISVFNVENNEVYWINMASKNKDKHKIDNADPKTFRILNIGYHDNYAKDKNKVYLVTEMMRMFNIITLEDVDPGTFQILKDGFSKDKKNVYHNGTKIEGADPETFVPLGNYSRDKNHVYFNGMKNFIIKNADPKTFQAINGIYSKDKNNVYIYKNEGPGEPITVEKIEGADPETFDSETYDHMPS